MIHDYPLNWKRGSGRLLFGDEKRRVKWLQREFAEPTQKVETKQNVGGNFACLLCIVLVVSGVPIPGHETWSAKKFYPSQSGASAASLRHPINASHSLLLEAQPLKLSRNILHNALVCRSPRPFVPLLASREHLWAHDG